MCDAMMKGLDNMEKNLMNMKKEGSGISLKHEDLIRNHAAVFACQHAAVNFVSNTPNLTMKDCMFFSHGFGPPSSKVNLPHGKEKDTTILYPKNKHAANNCSGSVKTDDFKPEDGMRTNLKIDFLKQSPEFCKYVENKKKANSKSVHLVNEEKNG